MRLEILLTAVLFFGGTFLSGYALRRLLKLKNEGFLFRSFRNHAVVGADGTDSGADDDDACLFSVICLAVQPDCIRLSVLGLFCRRDILEDGKAAVRDGRQYLTLGHLAALALICYQLYFIHHHMYLEWDDTYYVNLANEAVYSNQIYWVYPETGSFADFDKRYVLSLWPIFYAWLSKLIGVIPTVMAHTILPWLIIPLAYMIYALIGKRLFPKDSQIQGMFLAMAVFLHLFMSGQHTSGLTFLSITPWVGKGVLAAVLLPMLFYMVFRAIEKGSPGDWILMGITGLGGCLLSSMGIMLIPVFIGTSVLLTTLRKRRVMDIVCGLAACAPCLILGIYYIYLIH